MEEFRKKLKTRLNLCISYCCMALFLNFLLNRLTAHTSDFSRGMTMGILISTELSSVFLIFYYSTVLKNEEKLKQMYIKSKDERNLAIARETTRTGALISVYALAIAIIISGFYSMTISITLFFVLMASTLINVAVKLYYSKKM